MDEHVQPSEASEQPETQAVEASERPEAQAQEASEQPEPTEVEASDQPQLSPLEALADMEIDAPEDAEIIPLDQLAKSLPPAARATIRALQADYTRKTQALAEERRRLEAAMEEQRRIIEAVTKAIPELEEAASKAPRTDDGAIDLYDPDGLKGQIAEALRAVLSPVQEEVVKAQRAAEVAKFRAEHPDFDDLKEDIRALLSEREDLRLEDAYYIARGKRAAEMRRAQAEQVRQVGPRSPASSHTRPKFRSMHEAYEWAKARGGH